MEPAFDYDGLVYVRPLGRGVCLLDGSDLYVEEAVPDGYYRLKLTFERLAEDEERAAKEAMAA